MSNWSSLLVLGLLAGLLAHPSTVSSAGLTPSPCPILCGRDYNPVCAGGLDDKRSFLNECEMHAYNCRTKKELAVLDRSRVCAGDERLFE